MSYIVQQKYVAKLFKALFITLFFTNLNHSALCRDRIRTISLDDEDRLMNQQSFLVEQVDMYDPKLEKKEQITFKKGDIEATLGGMIKTEYYFYDDLTYLNSNIPEEVGAFKQTIDVTANFIYGLNKYKHKATEVFLDLRSKQKWGVNGAYKNTTDTEVKLNDVSLGEHSHYSSRPVPWFKDAWLKFSWNSVFNLKTKNLHKLKIGWFPFDFGRGIALGAAYATIYEGLGVYNYYADSSAPGIKLKGEIIRDVLRYDLYYSKFEDKSASVRETFNTIKRNHVGRKYNPWRGVAKDDELWGARLRWKPFDNNAGCLRFEGYFFYDEASDQKVYVKNDAHTEFGSYGLRTNYKKSGFECDVEFAFNYGHEDIFSIDQNAVKFYTVDATGNLQEQYSKITDNPAGGNRIIVYDESKNAVKTDVSYENGKQIGTLNTGPYAGQNLPIYSSNNRFSNAFRNKLDGYMFVGDISYKISDWNLTFATELAYASGDYDPHAKDRQYNKTFHGFLGLHEIYNGRMVKSTLLAGEREINVPTSLEPNKYEANGYYVRNNQVFSDKKYIGFSAKWTPKKWSLNPNAICFWKTSESYKYILDTEHPNNSHTSTTDKASKYIGTEANIIINYELLKDLKLTGILAFFFPGDYYKDVKGVPLKGDYFRYQLDLPDTSNPPAGVNVANYRISDDTAMFIDFALSYKF